MSPTSAVAMLSMPPMYCSAPFLSMTNICGVVFAPYRRPTVPDGSSNTAVGAYLRYGTDGFLEVGFGTNAPSFSVTQGIHTGSLSFAATAGTAGAVAGAQAFKLYCSYNGTVYTIPLYAS